MSSAVPPPSGAAGDDGERRTSRRRTASTEHSRAESLLGAWLLHACSAREAAFVEAHLRHCAHCADEVSELSPALAPPGDEAGGADGTGGVDEARGAGGVDGAGGRGGADGLWARISGAAFAARPPTPAALPPHVRPYAAQLATLDALLRELSGADWELDTVEGWNVAQLVSHLSATDSLLADLLARAEAPGGADGPGRFAAPDDPDDGIGARTAARTAWAAGRPPDVVHSAWRRQAEALRGSLAEGGSALGRRQVSLTGRNPLPVADHAVGRAFETWIHTTDIAGRLGRVLPPPVPASLDPMAELGVRLLPAALAARGTPLRDRALRVTLTGAGGGTWHLGTEDRAPDAELALDAIEFCYLVGGRRDPGTLTPAHQAGDPALVTDTLHAAPVFSGP